MQRLCPATTAVIVIDVQERLAKAMPEAELAALQRASRILLEGARLLHAPVFMTEQYPKGLGATLPEIGALVRSTGASCFEKLDFSAWGSPAFREAVERTGLAAAVVIGMETHVCVYQTVRDLAAFGLEVHVPIDGVTSRREDHKRVGLGLCERAGAIATTTETVVFDWLETASGDSFKQLSKLIR